MTSQEKERDHRGKDKLVPFSTFNGTLFLLFEQRAPHFSFAWGPAIYVTGDCLDVCICGSQKVCCFTSLHFMLESLCGCKLCQWVCVSRGAVR